jgi:iron complex outermembrane receptor protein
MTGMSHASMRALLVVAGIAAPALTFAQAVNQSNPFQLPTVTVTAQKEPADSQTLPVSVTAVSGEALTNGGVSTIRDLAVLSPNTQFSDFTARKLSNPRFRGIGSSPANPSITTYLDGVPQLNSNTSSVDLIDVEQLEFVRGPQSSLFGRNTLAGVINVASARPSLTAWTGGVSVPLANFSSREIRGNVSGPLVSGRLGVSGAIRYGQREGYTRNRMTGHDVDSREAVTGKGQLLWTPSSLWETRFIVSGERARDGDYALSDLGGLRASAFEIARDFEGHTNRDILATTILARRAGGRLNLTSTTGIVRWQTQDATDLDYTPAPFVRRENTEESAQFTQEVRIASAANAPIRLSDNVPLRWQAGVFAFVQSYEQDAINAYSPFVLSPQLPLAISQHSPHATLDDAGVGIFGQATATVGERVDVTGGARLDHESKSASLRTFYTPTIAPERLVTPEERFSNVSPQVSVAVRLEPDRLVYASVARGFKAGGFNAASPVGSEAYGEEQTWNLEGGMKTAWAGGRVTANAAVFRINWDDLQLNLPDPVVPAQFFIANVGGAESTGVEMELRARVQPGVDVFGAVGYTRARFTEGSVSSGVSVAGNRVPNTPDYTAMFGSQLSRPLGSGLTLFGGADITFFGAFAYDDLNMAEQGAYSLANLRAGVRGRRLTVEAWMRNAFDTHYVPVAFAFDPRLAPSGFLGESGAPRTFGINAGVTF